MPKSKVIVKFRHVAKRKKRRTKAEEWAASIVVPPGLSPLARYVESGLDSGLPISELVWQFQEYDCIHTWDVLSSWPEKIEYCPGCGRIERRGKRAEG